MKSAEEQLLESVFQQNKLLRPTAMEALEKMKRLEKEKQMITKKINGVIVSCTSEEEIKKIEKHLTSKY